MSRPQALGKPPSLWTPEAIGLSAACWDIPSVSSPAQAPGPLWLSCAPFLMPPEFVACLLDHLPGPAQVPVRVWGRRPKCPGTLKMLCLPLDAPVLEPAPLEPFLECPSPGETPPPGSPPAPFLAHGLRWLLSCQVLVLPALGHLGLSPLD